MTLGPAKMFRPVSKFSHFSITFPSNQTPLNSKFYIELVSKLTTRRPKWDFIIALYCSVFPLLASICKLWHTLHFTKQRREVTSRRLLLRFEERGLTRERHARFLEPEGEFWFSTREAKETVSNRNAHSLSLPQFLIIRRRPKIWGYGKHRVVVKSHFGPLVNIIDTISM